MLSKRVLILYNPLHCDCTTHNRHKKRISTKMEENKSKPLSLIKRMKQKSQRSTDEFVFDSAANMDARNCPNCGAGRGKDDGLTRCAYCGFEFLTVKLSDGINIKKEDNSR